MQATMETFEVEHYQMKAMIRKFDETLALKTNKTDFFDLRNKQE
jgi:S-ribosylhomocysteine lyase LuxS involved in autoinducer biosynthesis